MDPEGRMIILTKFPIHFRDLHGFPKIDSLVHRRKPVFFTLLCPHVSCSLLVVSTPLPETNLVGG